jgi:predicted nucleic acid-binding Zn ribbon protein
MERAARLFGKMKLPAAVLSREEMMRAVWPAAVGKKIAAHTRAAAVAGSRLIVDVEDAVWQKQLNTLRGQIISSLNAALGAIVVTDLDFRLAVPRRPPQIEQRVATSHDDAERIADPVLRRLYRSSRKKALA